MRRVVVAIRHHSSKRWPAGCGRTPREWISSEVGSDARRETAGILAVFRGLATPQPSPDRSKAAPRGFFRSLLGSGLARRLLADTRGLTTVEYTIVLCLIAALSVGSWAAFGGNIERYLSSARISLRDHLTTSGKGATP
jgi:Flp pilus assembly pilin Flp